MALRNRSTLPQGMLAPSGFVDTPVDPNVQATTRPAGTLLAPSPGYDSVRVGKNRFQGKGPTGGFRRMEFAEDVGGSGAALAVVPGETSLVDASEWLPEPDDAAEGSVIISDRALVSGSAVVLHGGQNTIPDMGDRHPSRPFSRNWFRNLNPATALREEYRENPAIAVTMGVALVYLAYLVGQEFERNYRSPRGIGTAATSVPSAGARTAGETTGDAVDKIGEAADKAVDKISQAAESAVSTIENAAKSATQTATGE